MDDEKKHSQEYLGEARNYWWNEDYVKLLANRLNLSSCNTLVDVGCGKGYMAYKFAPHLNRGAKVYGFDTEPQWIEDAQAKSGVVSNINNANFYFQVGDAYNLPLENDISDITVCQTLLIHLKDPYKAINQMIRITRQKGWVVAIEPNNIVNSLVTDNLTNESVEDKLELLEIQFRIELGKQQLGEGFNSIGDLVPQMFVECGLKDIQVWLCDKALPIIPPYDTREKVLRVQETLTWLDQQEVYLDYQGQLRYYLSGGGIKERFDSYWQKTLIKMDRLRTALENQSYISAGGSIMYIVAGRK